MRATAVKYERDNIDTDVIIPGTYLKIHDHAELATHAMEGLDPGFAARMEGRGILVAGRNFGCGSSREHAPIALAGCGVKAVLSPSFARIFYRNCVDGAYLLPVEITQEAFESISDGDDLEVDLASRRVINHTRGAEHAIAPVPEIISAIIEAGGIFKYGAGRGA
jgi:3-isopropylmalate/(R)-2-methylmalate dehydratase small subunit